MKTRRLHQTLMDYMVIGISPALIMGMVGSMLFFLLTVFYQGQHEARMHFIFAMFTMAIVLIARISMEEGIEYASLFGIALAGVTFMALLRFAQISGPFAEHSMLINCTLIGIVWWSAHKLTWDCTFIDDEQDASGEGLLQGMGIDSDTVERQAHEAAAGSAAAGTMQDGESAGTGQAKKKSSSGWYQRMVERKRRPHTPGVWVIYYAIAALPLFAFGQLLIPATQTTDRLHAFRLICVYLACALGLLLTTSFLGLRRYLRQRNLQMPGDMAGVWLGLGGVMILSILLVCLFLPRPGASLAVSQLPFGIGSNSPQRTSPYAFGKDGPEHAPNANRTSDSARENGTSPHNSTPSKDQSSGEQAERQDSSQDGSSNSSQPTHQQPGQQPGQQPSQPQSGQQSGQQQSGQQQQPGQQPPGQQPGQQSGPQQSGQEQPGRQQSGQSGQPRPGQQQPGQAGQSGQQQPGEQQQPSQQQPSQQQPSQQQPSQQQPSQQQPRSGQEQRPGQQAQPGPQQQPSGEQSDEPDRNAPKFQERQPQRSDNPDQKRTDTNPQPSQPPSNNPPQQSWDISQWIKSFPGWIGNLLKLVFFVGIACVAAYFAWKNRAQIAQSLAQLWSDFWQLLSGLWGGKRHVAAENEPAAPAPGPAPRGFASFPDPFTSGTAERTATEQLIRYSFEAAEAWGREHGCPRLEGVTPLEYAQQLAQRFESVGPEALMLGDLYSRVAYGHEQIPPQRRDNLRRLWQLMRAAERARVRAEQAEKV